MRFRRIGIVMASLALALVTLPAMAAAEMEGGAYYGMVQETAIDDLRVPLKYAEAAVEYQVARDNQGENAATIRMRKPRRLAAL